MMPPSSHRSTLGFARWKLLELAALFVEQSLARGADNISIEYDARLPDARTRDLRQVDVAVTYNIGGQRFLRVVEVQDHGRKVGQPEIGALADKASRVGAHRATIIAVAGFARPALRRIEQEGERLQAVRLRRLRPRDLPNWLRHIERVGVHDDTRNRSLGSVPVEHWAYEYAPSGEVCRYIALADISRPGTPAAGAIVAEPAEDGAAKLSAHALHKPGSEREVFPKVVDSGSAKRGGVPSRMNQQKRR